MRDSDRRNLLTTQSPADRINATSSAFTEMKKTTKLSFNMPTDRHRQVKAAAAAAGVTLQAFVLSGIQREMEAIDEKKEAIA